MLKKILHEPLFQFLALGALLFGLHGALTDPSPRAGNVRIVISEETVAWLETVWQKQWGRPPTPQEAQRQIEQHVREEVLYREALAMGLDEDDTIVKRRLAQKVEFLAKDLGGLTEPTEEELRASFEANVDRYREPDRIGFMHLYFSPDSRADPEPAARAALASLQRGDVPPDEAARLGDRFLLPAEFIRQTPRDVAAQFGEEFAERLFELEPGGWQGPVRSGYGVHLVRITEKDEGWTPELEQVRDAVELDLMEHRRQQALEDYYQRVRDKYEIDVTASRPAPPGGES